MVSLHIQLVSLGNPLEAPLETHFSFTRLALLMALVIIYFCVLWIFNQFLPSLVLVSYHLLAMSSTDTPCFQDMYFFKLPLPILFLTQTQILFDNIVLSDGRKGGPSYSLRESRAIYPLMNSHPVPMIGPVLRLLFVYSDYSTSRVELLLEMTHTKKQPSHQLSNCVQSAEVGSCV